MTDVNELVAQATTFETGRRTAAAARDAATVVLLRDGVLGVEAFLLRRVGSMAFAPGMYVYPGGSVDPADVGADLRWVGPLVGAWTGPLSAPPDLALALVCAAVRETFEESGVLLAGPDEGAVADVSGPEWEAERQALVGRQRHLSGVLADRGLALRADLLRPWSHWITPEIEPIRFDTRFFVAALPPGQQTRDVAGEADRTAWFRPVDALRRHSDGDLAMLPPTAFTLAEIAAYDGVDAVLAAATGRKIVPVLPRIAVTSGGTRLLLPGHPDYLVAPS